MTTRRKFLAGSGGLAARGQELFRPSLLGTVHTSRRSHALCRHRNDHRQQRNLRLQFDSSSGELKPLGLAAEAPSPSFLALSPDKQFLFAVNEIDTYQGQKTGAVSSYTLDKAAGKLTLINTVASGGSGPCHVNTDQTGRVLLVAELYRRQRRFLPDRLERASQQSRLRISLRIDRRRSRSGQRSPGSLARPPCLHLARQSFRLHQ